MISSYAAGVSAYKLGFITKRTYREKTSQSCSERGEVKATGPRFFRQTDPPPKGRPFEASFANCDTALWLCIPPGDTGGRFNVG
jgi:hypothetical protein